MNYIMSPYLRKGNEYTFHTNNNKSSVFSFLNNRSYLLDNNEMEALRYCREKRECENIIKKFGLNTFTKLVKSFLLLDYDTMWNQNHATHIEIETSTVCNWRCEYCPVKFYARKVQYIDMKIYKHIIDRAVEYQKIRYVTLHAYNEPTIDPHFYDYLDIIEKTDLKLVLYTNGSGLMDETLEKLKALKNLRNIVVTIPSLDPVKFSKMTGSHYYLQTTTAIKKAQSMGIPVRLSVQGLGDCEHMAEIESLKKAFPGVQCTQHRSFDRAGLLKNKYQQFQYVDTDNLFGCRSYMEIVPVNIKGDIFLCCNDFFQKNILGNLLESSLSEILSGIIASTYRKEIWGGVKASNDHICRKCFIMNNNLNSKYLFE